MTQPADSARFQDHGAEMHQSMLDVAIDPATSNLLLEQALEMPPGIYGSLEERAVALDAARKMGELFSDLLICPVVGDSLRSLRDGRLVAVSLTGLPIDPMLPPPPIDGGMPTGKTTFVSEAVGLGIGYAVGAPSLMLGEKKEALVHQITPVPGRERTQSNEGQVSLKFHQDLAPLPDFKSMPYDRFMPDFLVLTGLQAGSELTRTYIAALDDALEHVSDNTIQILGDKRFITNPPASFIKEQEDNQPVFIPTHPVLREHDGHMESVFDLGSNLRPFDARDSEAQDAISELDRAFTVVKKEVVIGPGTAAVFNNRRVAHGRGAVEVHNPTNNRWIQRVYAFNERRIIESAGFLPISIGAGLIAVRDSMETEERLWNL